MSQLPALPGSPGTPTSLPRSLDALLKSVAEQPLACVRGATIARALTGPERDAIRGRLRELDRLVDAPRGGADTLGELAILLAGFTITARLTEAQAEAQTEVYADATNDLPAWTIVAARRAWARGETDGLKGKIDPSFPPAPAHVRALALEALAKPRGEVALLRRLLGASVERSMPVEHRREMLRRMSGLVEKLPTQTHSVQADKHLTPAERDARLAAMAAEVVRESIPVDSDRGGH